MHKKIIFLMMLSFSTTLSWGIEEPIRFTHSPGTPLSQRDCRRDAKLFFHKTNEEVNSDNSTKKILPKT